MFSRHFIGHKMNTSAMFLIIQDSIHQMLNGELLKEFRNGVKNVDRIYLCGLVKNAVDPLTV